MSIGSCLSGEFITIHRTARRRDETLALFQRLCVGRGDVLVLGRDVRLVRGGLSVELEVSSTPRGLAG